MIAPYQDLFHKYTVEHAKEMIDQLKQLVAIRSDRGEALPGMPFGERSAHMLEVVHQLYLQNGFHSRMEGSQGYALAEYGESEHSIGLFAHADVVTAGNDWLFTDPYTPIEKDGFLIGRGVKDDKAAIVISLWCAKMMRELQIPLQSKLVMFTGGCEETGMQDISNFADTEPMPDFSLVCDTAFPIYIGDKGGVNVECEMENAFSFVKDFSGGKSTNVVLGEAQVRMPYSETLKKELETLENERIAITYNAEELVLIAKGISTHSALPQGSLNAAWLAASTLAQSKEIPENDKAILAAFAEFLEDYEGKQFDIATKDEHFGILTCTNGVVFVQNGKLRFVLNIRHGDTVDQNEMLHTLETNLAKKKCRIYEISKRSLAWRLQEDIPIVQRMHEVYQHYTGDLSPIQYNAGGTYARKLKNAIEVGPFTKGSAPFAVPPGHGNVHQPDEMLCIDGFLEAFEIIASMIVAADAVLCNEEKGFGKK